MYFKLSEMIRILSRVCINQSMFTLRHHNIIIIIVLGCRVGRPTCRELTVHTQVHPAITTIKKKIHFLEEKKKRKEK